MYVKPQWNFAMHPPTPEQKRDYVDSIRKMPGLIHYDESQIFPCNYCAESIAAAQLYTVFNDGIVPV